MPEHEVVVGKHIASGRFAFKCKTCGRGKLYDTPQLARSAADLHVEDTRPRTVTRRSPEEKARHRQSLVEFATEDWQRVPKDARAGDVDALVKSGQLESEVREEWDKQKGRYSHAYFGGAGVVKRKRRYIRRPAAGG